MRFVYEHRKTAQAASYLLSLADGSMNYMVLIKLLYLSDRRSLIETGVPITGDQMVAMPHGSVLSQTYDQINMASPVEPEASAPWFEYITEPSDYAVSAKKAPELDELSQYELDVLARRSSGLAK